MLSRARNSTHMTDRKHDPEDRTYDLAFWTALAVTIISIIIALAKLGIIP